MTKVEQVSKTESISFKNRSKIVRILEYFDNTKKSIADYNNDHNQDFDNKLFDIIFKKNFLKFVDSNIVYSGLETGDEYTFRTGRFDDKIIYVTPEGDNYIKDYHESVSKMIGSVKLLTEGLREQLRPAFALGKLNDVLELNKFAQQVAGINISMSKLVNLPKLNEQLSDVNDTFLRASEKMSAIYPALYDDIQTLSKPISSKHEVSGKRVLIKNIEDSISSIYNTEAYIHIFIIENYLREIIYIITNLSETNDFNKYYQFEQILNNSRNSRNVLAETIKMYNAEQADNNLDSEGVRLIDFFTFRDLIEILKNKRFGKNLILKNLTDENCKDYISYLENISRIRNKVSHNRKVSEDELNKLKNFKVFLERIEQKENQNDTTN